MAHSTLDDSEKQAGSLCTFNFNIEGVDQTMIEKVFIFFFALVLIFFIMMYPGKVVELVQAFVDAAFSIASALGNVNTHTA